MSSALALRRAILFDLDGTLIDSAPDLRAAVNDVLAAEALEPLDLDDVQDMIGDGAALLVERAFEARDRAAPEDALSSFKERYQARCLEETYVYDGVERMLERLRSSAQERTLAVVTNKPTGFAETILGGLGLLRYFDAVVGPERASARKPSPEHVRAALRLLDAGAAEAVMVGDGPTDIASGRDAGTATIAVLWGYRPRVVLQRESPDLIVGSPAELQRVLLG